MEPAYPGPHPATVMPPLLDPTSKPHSETPKFTRVCECSTFNTSSRTVVWITYCHDFRYRVFIYCLCLTFDVL